MRLADDRQELGFGDPVRVRKIRVWIEGYKGWREFTALDGEKLLMLCLGTIRDEDHRCESDVARERLAKELLAGLWM